jgi:hypothetical protein
MTTSSDHPLLRPFPLATMAVAVFLVVFALLMARLGAGADPVVGRRALAQAGRRGPLGEALTTRASGAVASAPTTRATGGPAGATARSVVSHTSGSLQPGDERDE